MAKSFGFTSSKRATLGAKQWDVKREKKKFAAMRSNIYGKFKTWLTNGSKNEKLWKRILADIEKYNAQVAKNDLPYPYYSMPSDVR